MNLKFLRKLDRWVGPSLLHILGPTLRVLQSVFPSIASPPLAQLRGHIVCLKLKGGGSLLIAYPALLGIRQAAPQAKMTLICTLETKVYAELLGIFDDYCLIDDHSAITLARSSAQALQRCNRAFLFIDLEINSVLASVFSILTMATRRIGLVKAEELYRAAAYTDAIALNTHAPIYVYYDQIAQLLKCRPATITECRDKMRIVPRASSNDGQAGTLGLTPFTSEFAPERMMPAEVWGKLMLRDLPPTTRTIRIFGSQKNQPRAILLMAELVKLLPGIEIINLCGLHSLTETLHEIAKCDMIWSTDSGLLHIVRLLGIPCRSFWGPTNPAQRLRPIDNLIETTAYLNFVCSPCVHLADGPPCKGDNRCMKAMADPLPNIFPLWRIGGVAT